MTASNFARALSLVLVHEGGYVNHPKDPGGATQKGVTQYTYNAYRKANGLSSRSVRSITNAEVSDIYRARYWNAVRGDDLPSGLDYAIFDFGVNSGPRRAIEFMQRIVGVDDDGQFGPMTMGAVNRHDAISVINVVLDKRLAWLKTLKTWKTFGKGWTNRIVGVRKDALAMVGAAPAKPIPPAPDDPGSSPVTDPEKPSEPVGWLVRFFRWLFG